MSTTTDKNTLQFITSKEGEKTSVILPIDEYYELLEDLSDISIVAERKDEDTISLDQVKEELLKNGKI